MSFISSIFRTNSTGKQKEEPALQQSLGSFQTISSSSIQKISSFLDLSSLSQLNLVNSSIRKELNEKNLMGGALAKSNGRKIKVFASHLRGLLEREGISQRNQIRAKMAQMGKILFQKKERSENKMVLERSRTTLQNFFQTASSQQQSQFFYALAPLDDQTFNWIFHNLPQDISNLSLRSSPANRKHLEEIAKGFPNLVSIDLAFNKNLTNNDLASLAQKPTIREINLSGSYRMDDDVIEQLAQFPVLERLNISRIEGIRGRKLKLLSEIKGLKELSIVNCPLRRVNWGFLANLTSLESFSIGGKRTSVNEALAQLEAYNSLTIKNLEVFSEGQLTLLGVNSISNLTNLERLTLQECPEIINDHFLESISKLLNIKYLKVLRSFVSLDQQDKLNKIVNLNCFN